MSSLSNRDSLSASLTLFKLSLNFAPRRRVKPVASTSITVSCAKRGNHRHIDIGIFRHIRVIASVASRQNGVPMSNGDHHRIVSRASCASSTRLLVLPVCRDDHYHVIVITVHTAHALQDDVVGIDHRYIKAENLFIASWATAAVTKAKKTIFFACVSRSAARLIADMSKNDGPDLNWPWRIQISFPYRTRRCRLHRRCG